MVQLKRMRRLIRDGIIKIEHQEQKVSDQSIRNFYVRIKMLFKHKLKMSYGDRQMTKKLYRRLNDFSRGRAIGLGLKLDEAKRRKEDLKKQKTRTTKSIIRDFIRRLKAFAKNLEDGLSATCTEEDEKGRVRAIAQLASVRLQNNSLRKVVIQKIEKQIELLQDACDIEEEVIRAFTVYDV